MDKLDKIFFENRADFDEEPQNGHFERFEQKLKQAETGKTNPITLPESSCSPCNHLIVSEFILYDKESKTEVKGDGSDP